MRKKIGIIGSSSFVARMLLKQINYDDFEIYKISIREKDISINDKNISLKNAANIIRFLDVIIDFSNPSNLKKNDIKYIKYAKDFIFIMEQINFECRYIFISSISVYGDNQNIVSNNLFPVPSNYYGLSKKIKEDWIINRVLKNKSSSNFNIIRPSGIIGKEMSKIFIKSCVDNALNNKEIIIYSKKAIFNTIINLENLVKYIIDNLLKNENAINIFGSKSPINLFNIASKIKYFTNSSSNILEREVGRKPFIILDSSFNKIEKYILSTEECLDKFLISYLKN